MIAQTKVSFKEYAIYDERGIMIGLKPETPEKIKRAFEEFQDTYKSNKDIVF